MTMQATAPEGLPNNRIVDADIYALPGMESGFHESWKALQTDNPELVWTDRNEGHWIALRGEIVEEVLSDHQRFSSRIIILPRSDGEQHSGLIPTTIDPPEHRWYRKQLNENLSLKFVRHMEEDIRALSQELIDGFAEDGEVNFTAEYAEIFPIRIFMQLIGLPQKDAPRLKELSDMMTNPGSELNLGEAMAEITAYLTPYIEERMENPGDDMLSRMVGRPFEDRSMTLEEALALSVQVLVAGMDTVVNFLAFTFLHLSEDHDLRKRLTDHPEQTSMAVAELFRRYGSVTIARTVREDMQYRGMSLRAGDLIACPTVVHGIDDLQNEDPMRVDIDRKRVKLAAFGAGAHRCPGQELARTEITITIQEWLKRIPEFTISNAATLKQKGGINAHIDRLQMQWAVTR